MGRFGPNLIKFHRSLTLFAATSKRYCHGARLL